MAEMKLLKEHGKGIIYAVFFASGFSALAYEVIWVRMLGLVLGNTVYAASLVLAAFMAGLGLGSYMAGRFVERQLQPLMLYGMLELGIGIFAVISPLILGLLNPIYVWSAQSLTSSLAALNGIRFALAFLALLIPTIMMGATFPVMSKYLVRKSSEMGAGIGILYGINTMGAMAGCLASGFLLIELLGILGTIYMAALINLLIAVIVLFFAKDLAIETTQAEKPAISKGKTKSKPKDIAKIPYSPALLKVVLISIGLSGFAAIAYEVIWTRALGYFVGHTSYAFTTMLATFLFGIGVGSLIISKVIDRIKNLIVILALVEIGIGILGIISIPLLSKLFFSMESSLGKRTWATPIGIKFIYCFLVMLLPTILMGLTFPLVSKIYVDMKKLGSHLGNIYSVNTFGGILGSLIGGFVIIPMLGSHRSIAAIAVLNVIIGAVLILMTPEIKRSGKLSILILSVAATAIVLTVLPIDSKGYSVTNRIKWGKSIYYKEGLTNTIEIIQRDKAVRDLFIDGELNASTSVGGILVHRLMAQIPLMLHPDPHSLYLVGLGSGMTAGAALPMDSINTIACAELSSDIVDADSFFTQWNHNILTSDRFKLQIEDGRIVLLTDKNKYDVMVTGIIHPKYNPGNAGLYSRDYYRLCEKRLADNGIMCQWIPLNGLRETEFKMIIKTFQSVFPNTSLWLAELFGGEGNYNAVLIGSRHPLKIDYELITTRYQSLAEDFKSVGINDPFDFLNRFAMGGDDMAKFSADAAIITDNHPRLEFGTVASEYPKILGMVGAKKEIITPYLFDLPDDVEQKNQIEREIQKRNDIARTCIQGDAFKLAGDLSEAVKLYQAALEIAPDNSDVEREYNKLQKTGQKSTDSIADPLRKANELSASGRFDEAITMYNKAIEANPTRADIQYKLGALLQRNGKIELAMENYNKALELDPNYIEAHNNLGIAYSQKGLQDKAENEFLAALKIDSMSVQALANLGLTYARTGRKELAVKTIEKAIQISPNDQNLRKYLDKIQNAPEVIENK